MSDKINKPVQSQNSTITNPTGNIKTGRVTITPANIKPPKTK